MIDPHHPLSNRHVYIYINGILTDPGAEDCWQDRAATWTNIHTAFKGDKFEYSAGPFTRRLKQQERAEKFARMVDHYLKKGGWHIHLVGHSNGCDIILRVLEMVSRSQYQPRSGAPPIEDVHLIAAACEADFNGNGLNFYFRGGTLKRAFIYFSHDDSQLKRARFTRILKFMGLGYGTLGLTGPVNHPSPDHHVILRPRHDFDHSTWFEKPHFDSTMKMITA